MDQKTREYVVARAENRCEYCQLWQVLLPFFAFHVEHIRARQHGGGDSLDNLCLSCPNCNSMKGPNQSSFDPITDTLARLFHPRLDVWEKHFRSEEGWIVGLTPEGRATVSLLQMNRAEVVRLRLAVAASPNNEG